MSWEEINKNEVPCPCRKGKIVLTTFCDDWNITEKSISIECDDCKKKYKIVEEPHHRLLASDGTWITYMLLPMDYPDFDKIEEENRKEYRQYVEERNKYAVVLDL